jgi:hypothetical protein
MSAAESGLEGMEIEGEVDVKSWILAYTGEKRLVTERGVLEQRVPMEMSRAKAEVVYRLLPWWSVVAVVWLLFAVLFFSLAVPWPFHGSSRDVETFCLTWVGSERAEPENATLQQQLDAADRRFQGSCRWGYPTFCDLFWEGDGCGYTSNFTWTQAYYPANLYVMHAWWLVSHAKWAVPLCYCAMIVVTVVSRRKATVKVRWCPHLVTSVVADYDRGTNAEAVKSTLLAKVRRCAALPMPDVKHLKYQRGSVLVAEYLIGKSDFCAGTHALMRRVS